MVKDNESFNPVNVSVFSSDAVMFKANEVSDLIKEFGHDGIPIMEEHL